MTIPLLFTYKDRIVGPGYTAEVTTHGRVLAVDEDRDVWIYGVEPGALAACGEDAKTALEAFRQAFTEILRDLASETETFSAFDAAVQRFVHDRNTPNEVDWALAVDAVRRGDVDVPGARRQQADARRFVEVIQETHVNGGRTYSARGSEIESSVAA